MKKEYNIEPINQELWEICNDFKEETSVKKDYIDYISALLYLIYYKNDQLKLLGDLYNARKKYYIAEIIDENIAKIKKKYLFNNMRFDNITIYRNIGEENILSRTIEMLYRLIMEIEKKYGNSKKYIAEAYEYILIQAMTRNDINIENGQRYTPAGIAKVMIDCLDIQDKELQIADPSCGTGNFILNIPHRERINIFGKEENEQAYNICITNLMLHDVNDENIEFNDFKETNYIQRKYDYIISNPPFTQRKIKTKEIRNQKIELEYGYQNKELAPGEYAYVLSMFEDLNDNGKMAVILPHGALFRENEKKVREELIKGNYIDAIIGLPENMFFGTRISVIIMILSKKKANEGILFIDASKEYENKRKINILTKENQKRIIDIYMKRENVKDYAYIAPIDEIASNDYNLTIKRYIKKEINKPKVDIQKMIKNLKQLEQERNILEGHIKDVLEKIYEELNSPKAEKIQNIEGLEQEDNKNIFYLKYHGEKCAKGILIEEGFIILKGSKIANQISEKISKSLIKAVETGRSQEYVNNGIFIKDYKCKSPSMAATIILGINTNGKTAWKNGDGKTIKELEEENNNKKTIKAL